MEGKKSFVLYSDQREIFEQLTDEQAGRLIKHIYSYVNDENPSSNDPFVNIPFTLIKLQLKRDLKKWEIQQEQRKLAGKKSAEIRKQALTDVNERSISSTVNDNVNVNVNDNVNVTVNEIVNDIYITEQAKFHFNQNSLDGNYISKMMKVHSQSETVINTELEKWIVKNEETVFNDLKHMKNSFNIWMMNFKPELQKSGQKPKSESKAEQHLKELLIENEKQEKNNY